MLVRIFGILCALGMFHLSWQCYGENKAFRLYGQKAQIEPIDHYTETTKTHKTKRLGIETGKSTTRKVDAFFFTKADELVEVDNVPREIVDRLIGGGVVEITYLSNNPQKIRYNDQPANTGMAALVGLVMLIASLFPKLGGSGKAARGRRARA